MRPWIPSIVIVLAACSAPPSDTDAGVHEACVPRTCASAGAECGALDDGCGGSLECGTCEATETCGIERANVCGGECTSDAHCVGRGWCNPARGVCTTECRGPTTRVGLDVRPVPVELVVTLDGAPMPTITSAQDGVPMIALVSSDLYPHVAVTPLYERAAGTDAWAPRDRITLSVLPGTYDLRYAADTIADAFSDEWPHGIRTLRSIEVGDEGTAITIDVPRVRASIELRLDGAPAPPAVRASFWLRDTRGNLSHSLTAPEGLSERWLVPGDYEAVYGGGDAPWPAGSWSQPVTVASGPVVIDLPSVSVAFDVTLAGMPTTSGPGFLLSPPGSDVEDARRLPPSGSSIVPGIYDLYLAGGSPPEGEWPASRALLDAAVEITTDRLITVDVPRVRVSATLLLAGTAVPSSDCGVTTIGSWLLRASAAEASQSAWLVPGRYPITYSAPRCERIDPEWPSTSNGLGEVVVSDGTSVVVDVPRVRATITPTLAAAPLPPIDSERGERGPELQLESRAAIGGAPVRLHLYETVDGGVAPRTEQSIWLSPGMHEVRYREGAAEYDEHWPRGIRTLYDALDIRSDGVVVLDVPRVRVDLAVTLSGASFDGAVHRDDIWWGSFFGGIRGPEIALVHSDAALWTERTAFRLYPEEEGALEVSPVARFSEWIVPGTYRVRYQSSSNREGVEPRIEWPFVSGDLGCWIAEEP